MMQKIIKLSAYINDFAENKDVAKSIRIEQIMPALTKGQEIVLDFEGINGATQSFMHALITDPIRKFKDIAFQNLIFKNANQNIKEIISIVYRYMQESMDSI